MPKLKLDVETLAVESFSTRDEEPALGTVYALSAFPCNTWDAETCRYFQTCGTAPTCNGDGTCVRNCWPQPHIDYREPGDPDYTSPFPPCY